MADATPMSRERAEQLLVDAKVALFTLSVIMQTGSMDRPVGTEYIIKVLTATAELTQAVEWLLKEGQQP